MPLAHPTILTEILGPVYLAHSSLRCGTQKAQRFRTWEAGSLPLWWQTKCLLSQTSRKGLELWLAPEHQTWAANYFPSIPGWTHPLPSPPVPAQTPPSHPDLAPDDRGSTILPLSHLPLEGAGGKEACVTATAVNSRGCMWPAAPISSHWQCPKSKNSPADVGKSVTEVCWCREREKVWTANSFYLNLPCIRLTFERILAPIHMA